MDAGYHPERAAFGNVEQGQRFALDAIFVAAKFPAIEAQGEEFQIGAVEHEVAFLAWAAD